MNDPLAHPNLSISLATDLKFVFFEKATKFDEIFILLLTNTVFPARLLNFCQCSFQLNFTSLISIDSAIHF